MESQSRWDRVRIFRAEKSYVVQSGRWYFEFEAVTTGEMRVGWARPELRPDVELGADELAYVFNGHRVGTSLGSILPGPVVSPTAFINSSIYLPIHPFTYLLFHPYTHTSTYLFVCLYLLPSLLIHVNPTFVLIFHPAKPLLPFILLIIHLPIWGACG